MTVPPLRCEHIHFVAGEEGICHARESEREHPCNVRILRFEKRGGKRR